MYFKSGDRVKLQSMLLKRNQQIKIHPSSYSLFPESLPIGSVGEVVDNNGRELFLRFMLRKPGHMEQDFLAGNTVYVTLPFNLCFTLVKV